jgi:hypothetical protein
MSWLGAGALLVLGGVGAGVLASSLTNDAIVWRAPSRWAVTEPVSPAPVDQAKAGESWARTAFAGGLKRCPPINAAFLAACEAEMKALSSRPAFAAGSYGGPLLITKVEPAPEQAFEPYRPADEPALELASYEGNADPPPTEEPTPDNYPATDAPPLK